MRDPTRPPAPPLRPDETEPGVRIAALEHRLAHAALRIDMLEDLVGELLRLCDLPDEDLIAWRRGSVQIDGSTTQFHAAVNTLTDRLARRRDERSRRQTQRR